MKETKLFELVTGTEMKPWLSRNMLPNINTCENWWSNFSAKLRVVSLKSLQLTQFAWPNLSICFNFLCVDPRDDVIETTRFLMRPPVTFNGSTTTIKVTCENFLCDGWIIVLEGWKMMGEVQWIEGGPNQGILLNCIEQRLSSKHYGESFAELQFSSNFVQV